MNELDIATKYFQTINLPNNKFDNPFVVAFIGLPGSGKSTVANALAKQLELYIASNDEIRRFLNREGCLNDEENQGLVLKIAEERIRYLLKKGQSYIIDADLLQYIDRIKGLIQKANAKLYIIRIVCPEQIVFKRIKERLKKVQQGDESIASRASFEDYLRRKSIHESLPVSPEDIYYTIDSSLDINEQINKLIKKIETDNRLVGND